MNAVKVLGNHDLSSCSHVLGVGHNQPYHFLNYKKFNKVWHKLTPCMMIYAWNFRRATIAFTRLSSHELSMWASHFLHLGCQLIAPSHVCQAYRYTSVLKKLQIQLIRGIPAGFVSLSRESATYALWSPNDKIGISWIFNFSIIWNRFI